MERAWAEKNSNTAGQSKTLTRNRTRNNTGMPDWIKNNFEAVTSLSAENVRVRYNSPKPAQLEAKAFTNDSEIHVAPGAESSLFHELGHLPRRRSQPIPVTGYVAGVPVNDNPDFEREADRVGERIRRGRAGGG